MAPFARALTFLVFPIALVESGLPSVLARATAPATAAAGAPTIDHKPVGCLVARRYARLDACVTPAEQVARARVYFRPPADANWYYVEMKPEASCLSGVLPRPSAKLVGRTVDYYLDVVDRGLRATRTAEFSPLVVAQAGECSKDPVAVPLAHASVTVFPSMPAGFVPGGISTGVIAAAVVGGGAATAGVIVAANHGSEPTTSATTPAPTGGVPPTPPTPPTPPSPSTTPLAIACTASPRSGTRPLRVQFTTSAEGGTGVFDFSWTFGDGSSATSRNPTHVYETAGSFLARVTVTSGTESRACDRDITVTPPPAPTPPSTYPFGLVQRITWTSQLDVPGARGQVVFHAHGLWISYPGPGLSHGIVDLPEPTYSLRGGGEESRTVRVEAQIVDAQGRPGIWRFGLEPGGPQLVRPETLRVVAGSLAEVGPNAVSFRMRGEPGERVVFTFRWW